MPPPARNGIILSPNVFTAPYYPMSNSTFVQEALTVVGTPEILVNVVSRRVRLLGQGARPLVEVHPRWTLMEIALREIADHKLTYELFEPKESPAQPKKRKTQIGGK